MFTNREIAIMIWVNIFILYCLSKSDFRKSIVDIIKTIFSKKIIILCIIIYVYIAFCIYVLYKIKFLDINLLKDTIIWSVTVPLISIMKAVEQDSKKYFIETLKSCFEIYILIEFIGVNYPFSIWIELIIIPTVLLLSLIGEFGEKFNCPKEVITVANSIVIVICLIAFIHSIRLAINDIQNFFSFETFKSLVYTSILTILYIPMTYLTLVFMNYETFWLEINFKKYLTPNEKKKLFFRAIMDCKINLNKIKKANVEKYIEIKETRV